MVRRRARRQGVVTGNPVRAEIEALPEPAQRYAGRSGPLRLLVVGGSLGAQVLNDSVPAALALIRRRSARASRTRAARGSTSSVQRRLPAAGVEAEVLPFIDDMAQRAGRCDVMVCRAGAITVSELARPACRRCWCRWSCARHRTSATTPGTWRSRAPRCICRRASSRREGWPTCSRLTRERCSRWPKGRARWPSRSAAARGSPTADRAAGGTSR